VREIDELIEKLAADNKRVVRFSLVGCASSCVDCADRADSLGGLIARYVSGVLFARGFFKSVTPASFMTIASPAIGIPGASSALSSFVAYAGARLLSRSGAQLYGRDTYARGKSLLEILAEPGSAPYGSLLEYERVSIYANAVNDRTVPFATGAFTAHDPFAAATKRAMRARAKRGAPADPLDERDLLDIREGGLEVTTHEHFTPVVVSMREIEPIVRRRCGE